VQSFAGKFSTFFLVANANFMTQELKDLVADVKEHVLYMQELGVELLGQKATREVEASPTTPRETVIEESATAPRFVPDAMAAAAPESPPLPSLAIRPPSPARSAT